MNRKFAILLRNINQNILDQKGERGDFKNISRIFLYNLDKAYILEVEGYIYHG